MEFSFESKVVVTLELNKQTNKSKHIATDFMIYPSDNLDESQYYDNEDLPNANGLEALRICMVQGLIGVLQLGNEKGYFKDYELLQKSIDELGQTFAMIKETSKSNFKQ